METLSRRDREAGAVPTAKFLQGMYHMDMPGWGANLAEAGDNASLMISGPAGF